MQQADSARILANRFAKRWLHVNKRDVSRIAKRLALITDPYIDYCFGANCVEMGLTQRVLPNELWKSFPPALTVTPA